MAIPASPDLKAGGCLSSGPLRRSEDLVSVMGLGLMM